MYIVLCDFDLLQAHFDSVSPELRVVDGARTKWCSLLMLDAMIFLLENDRFNPVSRRAFNQHDILLRCVLEELRTPHPALYEALVSNMNLTRSVEFPSMSTDAISSHCRRIPDLTVQVHDLRASAWHSLNTLRDLCLSDPTAKSKGKFLSIIDELCGHTVLGAFHYEMDSITEAVLKKAIKVLSNPICFHRTPGSSVGHSLNAQESSAAAAARLQSMCTESSDSEDGDHRPVHNSRKRKISHPAAGSFGFDAHSAFRSKHVTHNAAPFESVGSAEDDARPEFICSSTLRAVDVSHCRKAERYHHRVVTENEVFCVQDGDMDVSFDLALFDNYYHHHQRPLKLNGSKERSMLKRGNRMPCAAAAAASAAAISTSASLALTGGDGSDSDGEDAVHTHDAAKRSRSIFQDALSSSDPCLLRPWDYLDMEEKGHACVASSAGIGSLVSFEYEDGEQEFPPSTIHSPMQESDDQPGSPEDLQQRIMMLYEAEQSRKIDSVKVVVTPDKEMDPTNSSDAAKSMQREEKQTMQEGMLTDDEADNERLKGIEAMNWRRSADHDFCSEEKPTDCRAPPPSPLNDGNSSINGQLIKLPRPLSCSIPSSIATTAAASHSHNSKGPSGSNGAVNDVAPFPSPYSALHVLYGTVTSFSR